MFLPIVKPMVRIVLRIVSIIIFAITIVSAYGGYADTRYVGFLGVMVMALPYLGILSLIITLLWFLAKRWITGALGIATLAAVWGPLMGVYPLKTERNPSPGAQQLTLLSWNWLHGWDQDYETVPNPGGGQTTDQPDNPGLEFILDTDADIVCLQECTGWGNGEPPRLEKYLDRWNRQYPHSAFEPGLDNRVFSKFPVRVVPMDRVIKNTLGGVPDYIEDPRLLSFFSFYEVDVPGHPLLLVNVHLCSPGLTDQERNVVTDIKSVNTAKESASEFKNTIFSKLKQSFKYHRQQVSLISDVIRSFKGPTIICGDFNDVPESYAWRLLVKEGFKDAYAQVGFGPIVTYNKHLFWFHIDQIMYRGPLYPLSVKKGKIKTSDHYPLIATFEFQKGKSGSD